MVEALEIRGLTVRHGPVTVLEDISFTVRPGSIHALVGPPGSGRTTVLDAVGGLVAVRSGSLRLGRTELTALPAWRVAGRGVARTFDPPRLVPGTDVRENVLAGRHRLLGPAGGSRRRRWSLRQRARHRERVSELIAVVGLRGRGGEPVDRLGRVDRRRVELARALAAEPQLLLLDEPATGLDGPDAEALAALLTQVRGVLGTSVLFTAGDVGLAAALADRVTVLDAGRLVADGRTAQVLDGPELVRACLAGAELLADQVRRPTGWTPVSGLPRATVPQTRG